MSWSDFLGLRNPPRYVIGSDENGTGALAGPVLVTAVVYPFSWEGFVGLRDSKQYKKTKEQLRERAAHAELVYQGCLAFAQKYILPEEIDALGTRVSLLQGHQYVVRACAALFPDALAIVDGDLVIPGVAHLSVVEADSRVPAVAAASVMGKEEREWWMGSYAAVKYPEYGFAHHAGYGTEAHLRMLRAYGPCAIHRKSCQNIKRLIQERANAQ